MSRLIDADAFKEYMWEALEETRGCYPDKGEWAEAVTEQFCKDIDDQPTIEPQQTCEYWDSESKFCTLCRPSVQPQRKTGKWIEYDNSHCECPFCHTEWSYFDNEVEHFDFCPRCGAKMEAET